jgi:hypothetical protein
MSAKSASPSTISAGGEDIVITGSGFTHDVVVYTDTTDKPCVITSVTATTIHCRASPASSG